MGDVKDARSWIPGGDNDLASMSDDTVVTMSAHTLRTLLREAEQEQDRFVAARERALDSDPQTQVVLMIIVVIATTTSIFG